MGLDMTLLCQLMDLPWLLGHCPCIQVTVRFTATIPVRLYGVNMENWLVGESDDSNCGLSVALSADGSLLVVGEILASGAAARAGRVNTYRFVDNEWQRTDTPIEGLGMDHALGNGIAVSNDGSFLAAAASRSNTFGPMFGAVRFFENRK